MLSPFASHLPPSPEAVAAFKADGEVHPDLQCPITCEALLHPVRVGRAGQQLYSEDELVKWAKTNPVDPITRASLRGQVLLREPQATAAVNALRRGAAELHLEEGNAEQAMALRHEANACEAVDAQRPVAKLPSRYALRWPRWETLHAALRVTTVVGGGVWVGASVFGWANGVAPDRLSTTASAFNMTNAFMLVLRRTNRQARALAIGAASAYALSYVVPGGATLLGVAAGVASTYWPQPAPVPTAG